MTTALIYHEAAHILFSGEKPIPRLLGWLWNALEDRRIERLLVKAYPQFKSSLEFINDTVWYYSETTQDILAGCLFWGWENHLSANQRKFNPAFGLVELWEEQIKPLVEQAWEAANSDEVTEIAIKILQILGNDFEQDISHLPMVFWHPPMGDKIKVQSLSDQELADLDSSSLHDLSHLFERNDDSSEDEIDEATQKNNEDNFEDEIDQDCWQAEDKDEDLEEDLEEDDFDDEDKALDDLIGLHLFFPRVIQSPSQTQSPSVILSRVEGYARDLAIALKPQIPNVLKRPHRSRGMFNLERGLDGHERPFDYKQASAPASSVAILTLIDQSGSMDGKRIQEAIAATMLLDRASELAGIAFGVYGFKDLDEPIIHRRLSTGNHPQSEEKIATIEVGGGTYLAPVLRQAVTDLLARSEQIKILIIFHDGELLANDALEVKQQVQRLERINRFFLQPIFIADDAEAVEKNQDVFGHVLNCDRLEDLTIKLKVWLGALLKSR